MLPEDRLIEHGDRLDGFISRKEMKKLDLKKAMKNDTIEDIKDSAIYEHWKQTENLVNEGYATKVLGLSRSGFRSICKKYNMSPIARTIKEPSGITFQSHLYDIYKIKEIKQIEENLKKEAKVKKELMIEQKKLKDKEKDRKRKAKEKACTACGVIKVLNDFAMEYKAIDFHRNVCKECCKKNKELDKNE